MAVKIDESAIKKLLRQVDSLKETIETVAMRREKSVIH